MHEFQALAAVAGLLLQLASGRLQRAFFGLARHVADQASRHLDRGALDGDAEKP